MITVDILKTITGAGEANAETYVKHLSDACARYNISTPQRISMFLAQIAVESAHLSQVVEDTYYRDPARLLRLFPKDFRDLDDAKAVHAHGAVAIANRIYAFQNGNGGEASGDGFKYRGRGLGQISGKRNYGLVGNFLGLNLQTRPELLEEPRLAAVSAAAWWTMQNMSIYADAGKFQSVCGVWNCGDPNASARRIVGFSERVAANARAVQYFHSSNKNG